jgi:hypothetical protein
MSQDQIEVLEALADQRDALPLPLPQESDHVEEA